MCYNKKQKVTIKTYIENFCLIFFGYQCTKDCISEYGYLDILRILSLLSITFHHQYEETSTETIIVLITTS